MTRVLARFRLQRPLTERQMARLDTTRGVYGILGVNLDEANERVVVEYDATRLKPEEVEAILHRADIPALRE